MEHHCKHEVDLATMATNMEHVMSDTREILKIVKGDNGTGLTTKTALNRQSIRRMWWWLGGISMGIILLAIGIIKNGIT